MYALENQTWKLTSVTSETWATTKPQPKKWPSQSKTLAHYFTLWIENTAVLKVSISKWV